MEYIFVNSPLKTAYSPPNLHGISPEKGNGSSVGIINGVAGSFYIGLASISRGSSSLSKTSGTCREV